MDVLGKGSLCSHEVPPKKELTAKVHTNTLLNTMLLFFTGEFLPNFDLKNMILSYTKDFS
jgi:hypothetical protein